jgi:hypothetical protein
MGVPSPCFLKLELPDLLLSVKKTLIETAKFLRHYGIIRYEREPE